MMRPVLVATFLVVLMPGVGEALCAASPLVGDAPTATYRYTSTMIDSLEYAHVAAERTEQAGRATQQALAGTLATDVAAFVLAMKLSRVDYQCAVQLLGPFTPGPGGKMQGTSGVARDAATLAAAAYTTVADVDAMTVHDLARLLDAGTPPPMGQLIQESTDQALRKERAWKSLLPATLGVVSVLVQGPATEAAAWPPLRAQERDDLTARLERIFGNPVRQGPNSGQPSTSFAGAALYQTLMDPRLPTSP